MSPASARWACRPSVLSSVKRRDICSRPVMWGFCPLALEALAPRAGIVENSSCIQRASRYLQEQRDHSQSQESCQVQAELLWVGLAPQGVTSVGHLAQFPCPRIAQRPMRWKTLLVLVDAGKCVTAKRVPGEGRNLFLKEGLFSTLLLWSPWKWQRDPNKKSASLGKGGPNFPPSKSRL